MLHHKIGHQQLFLKKSEKPFATEWLLSSSTRSAWSDRSVIGRRNPVVRCVYRRIQHHNGKRCRWCRWRWHRHDSQVHESETPSPLASLLSDNSDRQNAIWTKQIQKKKWSEKKLQKNTEERESSKPQPCFFHSTAALWKNGQNGTGLRVHARLF